VNLELLLVLVVGSGVAADNAKDAAGKDLGLLQGAWQLVSATRDGKAMSEGTAKTMRCLIQGDRFSITRGGKVVEAGRLTLDTAKQPRAIDLALGNGKRTALGIYELNADTYRLCYAPPGKARPGEFAAPKGSGRTLSVWQRGKGAAAKTPPPPAPALPPGRDPVLRTASTHPMQYYLSLPRGWSPRREWPVVVTVDGGNKDWLSNARRFAAVRDEKGYPFILVTPLVLSNGGTDLRHVPQYRYEPSTWDRVDREGRCAFDREGLQAVLADVRARYRGEAQSFMTGWSAGGHLTWATVFLHPERLRGAALSGANYNGRCVTREVEKPAEFSRAPERERLPVKLFEGADDPALDSPQPLLAMRLAVEHGYRNLSRVTVADTGHDPMPGPVLDYFFSLLDRGRDAPAPPGKRPWTVLVYGAVDNSADEPLVDFLDKVRHAIDDDPGVELLLFIDRSARHAKGPTYLGEDFTGTRLYRLGKDTAERLAGGAELPEVTLAGDVELNSADATCLRRFIAWGKARAPARRYALMIYSHADGRSMCPDEQSRDHMGFAEVTEKVGVEGRVDFLALELCNMGGIEIAYQWRPGNGRFEADVLLAIPNAGPPLDWDRAFARVRTPGHAARGGPAVDPAAMTAADFGRLVIEEGRRGREAAAKSDPEAAHESAGCYDLRQAAAVKKAVDALAVELSGAGARDVVLELRGPGPDGAICYSRDRSNVDLYDLCRRVADCGRLPDRVRSAARGVMAALERFLIASFGMSAYKGFEAGKNGVYIVLPSGRPGCWRRFFWYTPLKGDGKAYGRWSFLRDGATPGNGVVENWFELLDLWFDEPDARGGVNGYRP
jgi:clostripain